jgi:hypothetical protein
MSNIFERAAESEKEAFNRLGNQDYVGNGPLTVKAPVYKHLPKLPAVGNPPIKK